ncbi:Asp-tRNA(Asn)/Glu-tRNA(Gln) amidotransferase subunit GatB [Sedimentisphaera salicampi]|uniref:Aspartyl/glutamyl-tRNA(Asn/Gln) amidotransferase subunit B n=1 Tax=Sedimentisphaera salicampi TaxID=1941349 RepID=A0A1W6LL94_9BACT|nr:Asp-tRNA(Asn)/Glu-tRNA(Gln) amidotransferase subunit GatB [Sedimentisphaera salicampi]ARN56524.1 Aspartyl/glutamyl-tRNA(Asn/Gln) amidotransferase subunit B [Sedimentisphaera salicampi]OXU15411.1 Aspartyl/glutamyl-tRNA(Asn/Gln) amidotransferase subunit B [Sedimentisphaera salicampi]
MSGIKYKTIVGLEIHVQLKTKTKMFCSCPTGFGGEANTRVCPVCLGMPGTLPVMNRQAYEYSVLAGLALGCDIPRYTKWDRKNYFYPDLPKGYQISQYDLPMSENGTIEIPADEGGTKNVRIIRAHLEEDAGKNSHEAADYSQVDLNRAGTPLLEIVTEPDMNSGAEVRHMATELQRIVQYLGVSEGSMQKGHMRFEPNINLQIEKDGKQYRTAIVEVKNLNSFKALEKSVDYETKRQLNEFMENGSVWENTPKSTRGWDADREITLHQRNKELANDYRYFPDPDLVPVELDEPWFEQIKSRLPELPIEKEKRFISELGLSEYDSSVLTAQREMAEYFENAINSGGSAKRVCNLLTQHGLKRAKEADKCFVEFSIPAEKIAELARMMDDSTVGSSAGEKILDAMIDSGGEPMELAEKMNLIQKSDAGELEGIVKEVFEENPKAVEDAKYGKKPKKSRGFLMGQVMKKSKGQANPKVANEIIAKLLDG